jgi:acetolactate synthase-1/2/3 large subunit
VPKKQGSFDRRGFLKGAAAGTAALVAKSREASAQGGQRGGAVVTAPQPSAAQLAADTQGPPSQVSTRIVEKPGSDYMVDVIKSLGFDYVAFNPGSSFEGLHESLINYGGNTKPEIITCCHEESSVAMAHGYAKIEGKPMLAILHGTIGIQHAAMAIYNAYGDRVPVFMITGAGDNAVPAHNAVDMAAMVRDFVKWDHQPTSLAQTGNSLHRAYKLMMTPPMAPVMVVVDADLQKRAMSQVPPVAKLVMPQPPAADLGSVKEIAKMLVTAENPRINAGRVARDQNGITLMVELAELIGAPVNVGGDRVNFPSRHPLAGNGSGQPDLILNLENAGGGGGGGGNNRVKTINISSLELLATHNFNVNGNSPNADLIVTADAQASLPALIEEVKKLTTADRKRVIQERIARHAEANQQARKQALEQARYGWDDSPISLARLAAELWPLIKNEDWSFVSPQGFIGGWPGRMWNMSKHYHYIGGQGAGGMGYGAPASVGAALANRKYGRISINFQTDGDLNYAPGVLWTAAHHKIPLLSVMANNRGYHAEVMFVQRMTAERNRGADKAHIGTTLKDPNIDYARMAQAYGMTGIGPISDPKDLLPALKRGLEIVKKGEPVMIDTITQPRG